MTRQIFVNLPVGDLAKAETLYTAIGAAKNPQFSDDNSACMVFTDSIFVMLMTHEKWAQFTKKPVSDARRASEGRFHKLCNQVLPDRYFTDHPRRQFLFHKVQGIWFDIFETIFCEYRGQPPPDFDVIDFVAKRAGKRRAEVAGADAYLQP